MQDDLDVGSLSNGDIQSFCESGFPSSHVAELAIYEGLRRGLERNTLMCGFDQFIEECLIEVKKRYIDLAIALAVDSDVGCERLFFLDAVRWLNAGPFIHQSPSSQDDIAAANEPEWPWPITEPREESSQIDTEGWHRRDSSALRMCGYHVGADGLRQPERMRLLRYFFRNPLPSIVEKHFGQQFGSPGSETRLRSMATLIARNCRDFKRNSRTKYAEAIDDWERDLAFLKQAFYRAGSFPWPPIESGCEGAEL